MLLFFNTHPPPSPPLFPYTTLFRSPCHLRRQRGGLADRHRHGAHHPVAGADDRKDRLHHLGGHLRSEEHTSELQSLTNLVCSLHLGKNTHQLSRIPHRRQSSNNNLQ